MPFNFISQRQSIPKPWYWVVMVLDFLLGLAIRVILLPLVLLLFMVPKSVEDFFCTLRKPFAWPYVVVDYLWEYSSSFFHAEKSLMSKPLKERIHPSCLYLGEELHTENNGSPRLFGDYGVPLETGNPLYVNWDTATSVAVFGSPGSQKSAATIRMLTSQMQADKNKSKKSIVGFVDCGGKDPEHWRILKHFADECGYKFHYGSLENEPSHSVSLLPQLANTAVWKSELSAAATSALSVGEGLGHRYFSGRARKALSTVFDFDPEADTFRRIDKILQDKTNKRIYDSKKAEDDLAGLCDAISEFSEPPAWNVSQFDPQISQAVKDHSFDFKKWTQEGGHCFYLRASKLHPIVPLFALTLAEQVKATNTRLPKHEHAFTVVAYDELHECIRFAPKLYSRLIAISRSFSLRNIFVTQNLAQIEGADPNIGRSLLRELLEVPVTLFFGTGDPTGRDIFTSEHGSEVVQEDSQTLMRSVVRQSGIQPELFRWLMESSESSGCFLARVARSGRLYSFGRSPFATDEKTFLKLASLGWPQNGELPGMIDPVPMANCFYSKGSNSTPQPPAKKKLKKKLSLKHQGNLGKFI